MAGSIDKARGLCNIFKIPKKPGSTDIMLVEFAVDSLIQKLPAFFESIEPWESKVTSAELIRDRFPQRFLQVLSLLSEVINTPIYMKKILENEDIMPKEQLIIIGHPSEVMFLNYMARYLLETEKLLCDNTPRPIGTNSRQWHAYVSRWFYKPFLTELKGKESWAKTFTDPRSYKIRVKQVLECLNKIYNFTDQIKRNRRFKARRIL